MNDLSQAARLHGRSPRTCGRAWILAALLPFLIVAGAASDPAPPLPPPGQWQAKVDPWVIDRTAAGESAEVLLLLAEQADLGPAATLATKQEKGRFVYEALTAAARRTQGPVLEELRRRGVPCRSYWVANMVWARAAADTVRELARREDIAWVCANPAVSLPAPERESSFIHSPEAVEWNVSRVNAPEVWAAGAAGEGAVVAGQDTGYQWDHPALKNQYRGWDGVTVNHDHNWHDAVHSGGGVCGADSLVPCDDYSHGTHTMGTAVGGDGGANQIGVAPAARWIGCRNMDRGVGSPATYSECYQWFLAPTRVDGSDPDPALAPDVINNSWSCTAGEGCTDPGVLQAVVSSVRAAGILTVHSAGNTGSACGTVNQPAAIYEEAFAVGATDGADAIAAFSSRGPVTVDGSGRRKPDAAAPGVAVRSAVPTSTYSYMSGTSMAAPHAAGLAALLLSANPGLAGNVTMLEYLMRRTALARTTAQGCGGDGPADVPNNVYGWGRIDALAACNAALGTGSLTMTLGPAAAPDAGARWRVDAGQWRESGETVSGLAVGTHAVDFLAPPGWRAPPAGNVDVYPSETAVLEAAYLPLPSSFLTPLLLE